MRCVWMLRLLTPFPPRFPSPRIGGGVRGGDPWRGLIMPRTGSEYLAGLRDGREVWLNGERVADVTAHPALAGGARAVAGLYDLQHAAADVCLTPSPDGDGLVDGSHLVPPSRGDL